MPLNDTYPQAVAFVTAERKQKDGSLAREPIGTSFVVSVPGRYVNFRYLVTASHVVYGESRTFVRVRM